MSVGHHDLAQIFEAVDMDNRLRYAHAAGRAFLGGARRSVGGSLSSDRYVGMLRNPGTSGVIAFIFAVVLYTDTTQWFRWARNPTLNSPQLEETARSLNLANQGVSNVEMLTDTTVPDESDFWATETRVTTNAPVPINLSGSPIPIPPGDAFAVVGGSDAAQETCVNVYFFEEDL